VVVRSRLAALRQAMRLQDEEGDVIIAVGDERDERRTWTHYNNGLKCKKSFT
jgi:hypothetical protein